MEDFLSQKIIIGCVMNVKILGGGIVVIELRRWHWQGHYTPLQKKI